MLDFVENGGFRGKMLDFVEKCWISWKNDGFRGKMMDFVEKWWIIIVSVA